MRLNSGRYRGGVDDHETPAGHETAGNDGLGGRAAADGYGAPDGYVTSEGDHASDDFDTTDDYGTADDYDTTYDYDALDDYETSDDYDGPDDPAGPRDSSAYWRRRFLILAGGITALGLCVWLLPGGHPAPARTSASARAAVAQGSPLPSAALGTSYPGSTTNWPSIATPSAAPAPSASAKTSHPAAGKPAAHSRAAKQMPKKSARTKPSAKQKKTGQTGYHAPAAAAGGGTRCKPANIVLSLFTSAASYAAGALPAFSVYAVSTSATPCTLSYGPSAVHVAVTRNGHVVWDSAACKLAGARRVKFTLGVPRILTMTWNRQSASPSGCAGSLPADATGTFDAVAVTAGQSSPVHSFKLQKAEKPKKSKKTEKAKDKPKTKSGKAKN